MPLAMQRGSASTYFAQDALSSVTSLTDQTGAVTGRYRYDTYGQITATSGAATSPYTYTGREWDSETGVYDYRARQYDPTTGRFLSEDPVASVNGYVYTNGNPVLFVDPAGTNTLNEAQEVPILGQILMGATIGGVSRVLRCGWDTREVVEEVLKGAGGGLLGGVVGKVVYAKLGGMAGGGVAQQRFNARLNLFVANMIGAGLSVMLSDALTGDFDPFTDVTSGASAGAAAAAIAGSTLPVSLLAVASGLLGAVGVEAGRAGPGGPSGC